MKGCAPGLFWNKGKKQLENGLLGCLASLLKKKNLSAKKESAQPCLLDNNCIEEPEQFVFLNTATLKPTKICNVT